jgi:hypothetical protein
MAKVTAGKNEVRSNIAAMIRGPFLLTLEEYGIKRPDRLEFTYVVERLSILMTARWGKWCVDVYVDEGWPPAVVIEFVEKLAADANVPIAEEL